MNKMMLLLWLCLSAGVVHAQQNKNVVFKVELRYDTIGLEETFEVRYTLENAEVIHFQPPTFRDFQLVGGPSTSNSFSMINGVTTRSMTYTYFLKPTKIGAFELPIAEAETKDGLLKTEKMFVVVSKEVERAPANNPFDSFGGMFPPNMQNPFNMNPQDFFNFQMPNFSFPQMPNMDSLWKDFDKLFDQQLRIPMPPNTNPQQTPKKQEKTYKL